MSQAVAQIKDMFPSFDEDVLTAMLAANNNHIEHTIEQVLQMEADSVGGESGGGRESGVQSTPSLASNSSRPAPAVPRQTAQNAAPAPARAQQETSRPTPSASEGPRSAAGRSRGGAAGGRGAAGGGGRSAGSSNAAQAKRGTNVKLPEAFLRAPGWRETPASSAGTIGDEQLAIMLQDELFRKELQQAGGMGAVLGARDSGRGTGDNNGDSRADGDSTLGGGLTPLPDMGILKGLSSLSAGARSNLNGIAQRWNARGGGTGGTSGAADSQVIGDGVSMSLLHSQEEHEEEEEVIDFQGGQKKNQ